jgi:nucleotide-binding universal stress UspA family protein
MTAAPIHRILVPVDFSPCSRAALEYAAELADRNDAKVEVLHVHEPAPYVGPSVLAMMPSPPRRWDETQGDVLRELEGFVGGARDHLRVRVETGLPGDVIPAVAKQGDFDLIVMGTHGRSGLARALLGSVAETVMRRAPVPVLTLRMPRHEPREAIPL